MRITFLGGMPGYSTHVRTAFLSVQVSRSDLREDDGMMPPHGALYQCCVFVAAAGMHSGEKEGVE